MRTTKLTLDGLDVQIIHDALLVLHNSEDHAWDDYRIQALLIQFMNAAERLGVSVEVQP